MSLDVRYARSFLVDIKNLEYAAREHIYAVVFEKYKQIDRIKDLPGLKRLDSEGIFYRFSVDNYIIGVELTGHIVKFLRVLPKPDI
ncbi:cytotoxic translational repressor of toxin-antitoxin stability system [Argonema antarcticum]|uniref:cytotoxic translational repressor of toxin-antitoxin stability system n=1 Tax=Argonema antarcticum TaxID=2942763 RepID=UPI002012C202|nr:cytotoxic translational repressor of toxin-antitoxin stability system [Argonema antarcticum]MCL1475292.1 cytotoxic translational repressor of toxin-antitoxin stability system [Argonema antarcticum A004/B2]